MEYIDYNINENYLSHWTKEHAFREIMQNFIDYGVYKIEHKKNLIITNNYEPKDLSFMSVGLSVKENKEAIGKYGEGLKMALMIFTREGYDARIRTNGHEIKFVYKNNEGKEVLLKNESAESVIKNSGFFKDAIIKLKSYIASKLGIYEMLIEFKKKHVFSDRAIEDFDMILGRFESENNKK